MQIYSQIIPPTVSSRSLDDLLASMVGLPGFIAIKGHRLLPHPKNYTRLSTT